MTGFALDANGDISIKNNQIQMINGSELTKQTIQTVIGTNKGEWCLNEDEGITFGNILGKHMPDNEVVKTEIEQGLLQVDDFNITEFSADFDSNTRKFDISFQAESSDGTVINIENSYN